MAKTVAGRKHSVSCKVNVPELTKAGTSVEFEVHADGEKIGTITLGRGSITWKGGKKQKEYPLSWTRFAALMNRECYGEGA